MEHHPAQVLCKSGLVLLGKGPGLGRLAPKIGLVGCQPVRLQLGRSPLIILAHQHKVPVVGHQHLTVLVPIL